MIDATFQRASILQQQGRHADAERELRRGLSQDPDNPMLHAMLAMSLAELQQYSPATDEAAAAIRLAPDHPMAHYAMAKVMLDRQRFDEALAAANDSIRLDMYNPDTWTLISAIRIQQRQWPSALEAAEKALEIDAQHSGATNLRAISLVQLGRRDEAAHTLGDSLAQNPEDPLAHANEGWRLLHQGDPKRAMEHFRESLRLDPTSDWARSGIVEALKARNFIYRWMLAYFLWMSRLSSGVRWGIIIGGYLGVRFASNLAQSNPSLAPILTPLIVVYLLFAVMTWLSAPLFNLLLRFSKFGKLVLNREQKFTSELIAGVLLVSLCSLAAGIVLWDARWVSVAIVAGLLIAPVSMVLLPEKGWPRWTMVLSTIALAGIGATSCALDFIAVDAFDKSDPLVQASNRLSTIYIYGILVSQFGGMWLCSVRVKK